HHSPHPLRVLSSQRGLSLIRFHSLAYDLITIIIADDQFRTIYIADFINARRLRMDVVDPSTGGTSPSSSNPEQQLIIVHLNPYHNRQPCRPLPAFKELKPQKRVQPSHLFLRPRESIQHESPLRVRFPQSPRDNVANQVVGNQFASCNQGLHLLTQPRSLLHVLPKQVPG